MQLLMKVLDVVLKKSKYYFEIQVEFTIDYYNFVTHRVKKYYFTIEYWDSVGTSLLTVITF